MKKAIALILVGLLAFSLTACDDERNENSENLTAARTVNERASTADPDNETPHDDPEILQESEETPMANPDNETPHDDPEILQKNGDASAAAPDNEISHDDPEILGTGIGVEMEITQLTDSTNPAKMVVTITNNSTAEYTIGEYYEIEKLNGNKWEKVPLDFNVDDVELIIAAGGSHNFNINLYPEQYKYTAGTYRVIKGDLYTEFTIN